MQSGKRNVCDELTIKTKKRKTRNVCKCKYKCKLRLRDYRAKSSVIRQLLALENTEINKIQEKRGLSGGSKTLKFVRRREKNGEILILVIEFLFEYLNIKTFLVVNLKFNKAHISDTKHIKETQGYHKSTVAFQRGAKINNL